MNSRVKAQEWIRWFGVAASVAILFTIVMKADEWIGQCVYCDWDALPITFVAGILPAFLSIFTNLARCFWPDFIVGPWFVFAGIIIGVGEPPYEETMFFMVAALSLCATPILNMIFRRNQIDEVDNSAKS